MGNKTEEQNIRIIYVTETRHKNPRSFKTFQKLQLSTIVYDLFNYMQSSFFTFLIFAEVGLDALASWCIFLFLNP